jgi:hypothetical protein
MPHLTRKPGDTIYHRGLWYRDEDDVIDTRAEYARDERAPEPDEDEED